MNGRKSINILFVITAVIFSLFFETIFENVENENSFLKMKIEKKKHAAPTFGDPTGAMEYYYKQRAYPNGKIPENWRREAMKHIQKFNVLEKQNNSNVGSWTELGPDNIGGRIRVVIVDHSNSNRIYAGSVSGGVWKSTNGGNSWFPLKDDMENLAVCSMVMDPNNPNIIYAGTGEGFFNYDAKRGEGIFKTTDGGSTWIRLKSTDNSDFYYVNKLVIDPTTNTFWAATRKGLFKSTDGGLSFTAVIKGQNNGNVHCTDIEIAPTSPSKIFASFGMFNESVIYRSTNSGATFDSNLSHPNHGRIEIAVAPSNPNVVYAAFMDLNTSGVGKISYSTDGGDNWSNVTVPGPNFTGSDNYAGSQGWYNNILAVDPDDPQKVYAGGIDFWKSTDNGNTWKQVTNWYSASGYQFVHADHHSITFDPNNSNVIYLGTDGGVYKSTDRGGTWTAKNNGLAVTQFYYGAVDQMSDNFYGGTQDNGTLKSSGSSSWNTILGGDGGATEVNFNNPDIIFMEYVNLALYKSTDGGNTFNKIMNGIPAGSEFWDGTTDRVQFIAPFEMDINNPQNLIAGTYKVYKTTNGGTLWSAISGDLTTEGSGSSGATISTLTVAPGNSNVIYVGCSNGVVQVTTDNGANWTDISSGLPNLYCTKIRVSWSSSQTAVAVFSGYSNGMKVFKTTNGGASWNNISGNLPNIPVNSVFISQQDDNIILVGTDLGVFLTMDNGANWFARNNGLPNVVVADLDYRVLDDAIFAATHGRGMFKATFSELTGVDEIENVPQTFALRQNYPNPFNPSTNISFYLPKAEHVSLTVYDALGREVVELVNGQLPAGEHNYEFNAAGLSSGIYIYRLSTGNFVESRKMMLLK